METLRETLRFFHIAVGFAGLAAFWVPIVVKKGAYVHKRAGKVFEYAVYIVTLSAITNAFMIGIAAIRNGNGPGTQPSGFGFLVFLAYLGLVVFATARHGVRVLDTRMDPEQLRTPIYGFLAVSQIAASIIVIVYSIVYWSGASPVFLALSPIGLLNGRTMWLAMTTPPPFRMSWWYEHMGAMIGAGIGFHTAFAVFGASQFFNYSLEGPIAFVPWILPAAVGLPATRIWTRKYMRKFNDLAPGDSTGEPENALAG